MSRLNWENEEGYEESPIVFPDDGEDSSAESRRSAQDPSFTTDDEIDYDMRGVGKEDDWSIRSVTSRMRRSSDDSPVKYPEGSLGAFSTPEDYEAHMDNEVVSRDEQAQEIEYDDPILLFPPDEIDDDFYRTTYSGRTSPRLDNSTEDGDLDDSIGISFSRYTAENKEGEFFFMPFLDIPDESDAEDFDHPAEEEEEEVSFSFRKVDADQVKKEKEFIFMPFLNASEETPSDLMEEEEELHNRRSSKGTIFDEGLYLIPLESEEEEEKEQTVSFAADDDDGDDDGISFVSAVGGVVPRAPKVEGTGEKKTSLRRDGPTQSAPKKKKKRPPAASKAGSAKKQSGQGGKKSSSNNSKTSGSKNSAAEEQFRLAMRNVSPEIRAAVKNDPVQRAALEQAVRIALVQQAAQEAVEKATGRPVFGSFSGGGKKKRPPRPPQQRSGPAGNTPLIGSRARSVNFSPFSLRTSYDDGGVSEFGTSPDSSPAASEFGGASAAPSAPAAQTAPAAQSAAPSPELGTPDGNQDPVLALLNGTLQDNADAGAPGTGGAQSRRASAYQSPAAVRAAMRTGLDVDTPQQAAAATATGPKTVITAADRELQVKRSGCLIWIIVAFVVFFVGLVGVLVMPNISKQTNFDKALSMMEHGQYLQAIQIFEGFTENDTKYFEDCRNNISQCAYLQANRYFSEGKYYEAYNLLVDKAEFNEETKALALRANYNYAEQRYAEGDWQNAANAYINLLGEQYEDSQEKYNICQYQLAMKNADDGSFMQAHQIFTSLGEYSDSRFQAARMIYESWNADALSVTGVQLTDVVDTMEELGSSESMAVVEKIYSKAGQYAGQGEHKMAYETYIALGGYADSEFRSAQALYNVWFKDYTFGTLAQRRDAMAVLRRSAEDNEQAATMLTSAGFNPIRLLGRWTDGDSSLTFSIAEGTTDKFVINLDVASINDTRITLQSSDVIFEGNVVFRLTDPNDPDSRRSVLQITSFDDLAVEEPDEVTLSCFLNNRDYSFVRQ